MRAQYNFETCQISNISKNMVEMFPAPVYHVALPLKEFLWTLHIQKSVRSILSNLRYLHNGFWTSLNIQVQTPQYLMTRNRLETFLIKICNINKGKIGSLQWNRNKNTNVTKTFATKFQNSTWFCLNKLIPYHACVSRLLQRNETFFGNFYQYTSSHEESRALFPFTT